MAINFISCKPNSDKKCTLHVKSDSTEIMIGSETDEIIEKTCKKKSLSQRYQKGLEKSLNDSDIIFDGVDAFYYNFNKISLSKVGSYIDSPKWMKNKKATINPKNNDEKCFQYALTAALN